MKDIYKPAKISRPSVKKVYHRRRLYEVLEQSNEFPVTWLQAPPGSGKTSLISGYLESTSQPHVWYQMDEGDIDVASFFYYMKQAIQERLNEAGEELPMLSAPYLSNLTAYAKIYFRGFFSVLPRPSVIVIDNYQDVPAESKIHEVIESAIGELPEGIKFVILSREQPPHQFAKIRMNNSLRYLGWEDLKFTLEESCELGRVYGHEAKESQKQISDYYVQTQGWVLGLLFLLERDSSLTTEIAVDGSDKKVIFDYFAGEILEKEPKVIQKILFRTSLLDQFTLENAKELCERDDLEDELESICERNSFIHHVGSKQANTYAFLPLFKDFLLNRFETSFDPEEVEEIKRMAANILLEKKDYQNAATLLMGIEDWSALKRIVLENAQYMFIDGRYLTVQHWISSIPNELKEEDPWLQYWEVMCRLPFREDGAAEDFKALFQSFMEAELYDGAYLTWVMAMESMTFSLSDMRLIEYWQDKLDSLRLKCPEFSNPEVEARVTICILGAFSWRNFNNSAQITNWAQRAEDLLDNQITTNYKMAIASSLVGYYGRWVGDWYKCSMISERIGALIADEEVVPTSLTVWYIAELMVSWMTGRPERALEIAEKGIKLIERRSAETLDPLLQMQIVYGSIAKGDLGRAKSFLENAPGSKDAWVTKYTAHYHFLKSVVALESDEFSDAKHHSTIAFENVDRNDLPLYLGFINLVFAQSLFECGERAAAHQKLSLTKKWVSNSGNLHVSFQIQLIQASWYIEQNLLEEGLSGLEEALFLGKTNHFLTHPWFGWRRPAVQKLYSFALDNDIESDYINMLIEVNKVVPNSLETVSSAWPWLLKIQTLGTFSIMFKGRKIDSGKFKNGELELIKLVSCFGGKQVETNKIVQKLWPNLESEAGQQALDNAVASIHKNLGRNQIIIVHKGAISFHASYVWVDLWAASSMVVNLKSLLVNGGDIREIKLRFQQIVALLDENFLRTPLNDDIKEDQCRHLKHELLGLFNSLGQLFEAKQMWEEGVKVYDVSLFIEPANESLYAHLMTCQYELGKLDALEKTYQRCIANIAPTAAENLSKEIQSLYAKRLH